MTLKLTAARSVAVVLFIALGCRASVVRSDIRTTTAPLLTERLRNELLRGAHDARHQAAARRPPGGTADGVWQSVPAFQPRSGAAAVFDRARNRIVVIGGAIEAARITNEVWTLSLAGGSPEWTRLATTNGPSLRYHSAVYDRVRDRIVVFGGSDGTTLRNETWALSLTEPPSWTQLSPGGTVPSPR